MSGDEEEIASGDKARAIATSILGKPIGGDVVRITIEPAPPNQTGAFRVGDATVFHFAGEVPEVTYVVTSSNPVQPNDTATPTQAHPKNSAN